jgi:hypothetical protein
MNNNGFECPKCHKFFSLKDKLHISLCKKNNIINHPRDFFQNNNSEIEDDNFFSFNINRNNGRPFIQNYSNNTNWNMNNLHKYNNNQLSISKEQSITFDSVPNDFCNFFFSTLYNDDINYLPKNNDDVFVTYDKTLSSGNNNSLNQLKNKNNEIKNNNGSRSEINPYASQNYNKKYFDRMNKYNSHNYRDHRGNNRNYNFRYRGRGSRGRGRRRVRGLGHFNRYNRSNYYRGDRYNNIDWNYNDNNNVDMLYNDNMQNIENENKRIKNDEQNKNEFINNEINRNNIEDDDDFPRNNIFFNYLTNPFLNTIPFDEDNSDDNEDDRFNLFNYYFDDNIIYGFDLLEPKGLTEEKIKSLPKVIFNKDLKKEKERCVICLDDFKEGDVLINIPCFHYFHLKCITEWFKNNKNCPICKYEIKEED